MASGATGDVVNIEKLCTKLEELVQVLRPHGGDAIIRSWFGNAKEQFKAAVWDKFNPWVQYGIQEVLNCLCKEIERLIQTHKHIKAIELMVRLWGPSLMARSIEALQRYRHSGSLVT